MPSVRPDFSEFVAHFARSHTVGDHAHITSMDARQRLAAILTDRRVLTTRMPWFGARCAAFTECTWTSLLDHAQRYSSFGIGFEKSFLWGQGGGPAIYLRCPTLYDAQAVYVESVAGAGHLPFSEVVKDFLTPFAMEPFRLRSGQQVGTQIDFSHEREWREPAGLAFNYSDVQFVIVNDFDDLAALPQQAVESIGQDRFLSISNYRRIEELWPTLHITR